MSNVDFMVRLGGCLAVLTSIHFAVDFIFQSHAEAMVKHNNPRVRAKHCLIYTLPFLPLLLWAGLPLWQIALCSQILFWSHFCEDTYIPVFWWAKHIRKVPSMQWKLCKMNSVRLRDPDGGVRYILKAPSAEDWRGFIHFKVHSGDLSIEEGQKQLDRGGFREFVETALGKILMIAIDQIIHISFLFPVAWFLARV